MKQNELRVRIINRMHAQFFIKVCTGPYIKIIENIENQMDFSIYDQIYYQVYDAIANII